MVFHSARLLQHALYPLAAVTPHSSTADLIFAPLSRPLGGLFAAEIVSLRRVHSVDIFSIGTCAVRRFYTSRAKLD